MELAFDPEPSYRITGGMVNELSNGGRCPLTGVAFGPQ
jgi:hypothetical protein